MGVDIEFDGDGANGPEDRGALTIVMTGNGVHFTVPSQLVADGHCDLARVGDMDRLSLRSQFLGSDIKDFADGALHAIDQARAGRAQLDCGGEAIPIAVET